MFIFVGSGLADPGIAAEGSALPTWRTQEQAILSDGTSQRRDLGVIRTAVVTVAMIAVPLPNNIVRPST
jgi:hypothetical protein